LANANQEADTMGPHTTAITFDAAADTGAANREDVANSTCHGEAVFESHGAADTHATLTAAPTTQNALQVLHSDHQRLAALLSDCLRLANADGGNTPSADRSALLERVSALLRAHSQLEVELFYPTLHLDAEALGAAQSDHDEMLVQLASLVAMHSVDDHYLNSLQALVQLVEDHVRFEVEQLFPLAAQDELADLGARLAVRRGELLGHQGFD
jgi:hypothetical protein